MPQSGNIDMLWKDISMGERLRLLKERRASNPTYSYFDLRSEYDDGKDPIKTLPPAIITPERSYINRTTPAQRQALIDSISNNSNAEFIQRLNSGEAANSTIPNWNTDEGGESSLKMSYTNVDNKFIVYPNIQKINGQLHDFTDPQYKQGERSAIDSALKTGDYIEMPGDAASWFSDNNYKHYYPGFDKFGYKHYDNGKDPINAPATYNYVQPKFPNVNYNMPIPSAQMPYTPQVNQEITVNPVNNSPVKAVDYTQYLPSAQEYNEQHWELPTYNNSKYTPSQHIRKQIYDWEGASMKTNAPIDTKAKELTSLLGSDLTSHLSQDQMDSLTSYYYNIMPSSFKPTLNQLKRLPSATNKNEYNQIMRDVSKTINVGYNRKGMSGLAKRRAIEQMLFLYGH